MVRKTPRHKKPFINVNTLEGDKRKVVNKEILSLLMNGVSPNGIRRHFKDCRSIKLTRSYIRTLVISYGKVIKKINKKFDTIAARMISILEMDETFKGMKKKILVVMDSLTGYVFLVKQIAQKSKKCIINALNSLDIDFNNVKLVLTDGAPYFPKVIQTVFPHAKHQICLVHVMRTLSSELRKLKEPYTKTKEKRKEISEKIKKEKEKQSERIYNNKLLKQQYDYNETERKKEYKRLNIKKGKKGIHKAYPHLKKRNLKLNSLDNRIKSFNKTIKNTRKKILRLKEMEKTAKKEEYKQWNLYMKECKIYWGFYRLFFYSNKKYQKRKTAFLKRLDNLTKNDLIEKIIDLLTTVPGLDAINRESADFPLKRNFQNTNGIESFNSRFRSLLDTLRVLKRSIYSDTLFQLFRLYINTTTPTTSSRGNCSPIELYGYDLREKSTVEIIIDGLPSGPQYEVFLPEKNTKLLERKLKKIPIFL